MPNEPWGHVVYWTYCHFFGPQFEGKTQNWRTVLRLDANSYCTAKTKSNSTHPQAIFKRLFLLLLLCVEISQRQRLSWVTPTGVVFVFGSILINFIMVYRLLISNNNMAKFWPAFQVGCTVLLLKFVIVL